MSPMGIALCRTWWCPNAVHPDHGRTIIRERVEVLLVLEAPGRGELGRDEIVYVLGDRRLIFVGIELVEVGQGLVVRGHDLVRVCVDDLIGALARSYIQCDL